MNERLLIRCGTCGVDHKVPQSAAGKVLGCPACHGELPIPRFAPSVWVASTSAAHQRSNGVEMVKRGRRTNEKTSLTVPPTVWEMREARRGEFRGKMYVLGVLYRCNENQLEFVVASTSF